MHATTSDLTAAAADERDHRIAVLESEARTWTGPVKCVLCGCAVSPTAAAKGLVCRCPEPRVETVDDRVKDLETLVRFLEEEVTLTRKRLEEKTALAEDTASMLELARQHASDLETVLAFERGHVARFVRAARGILAGAGAVEPPAPLAGMVRPQG